MIHRTNNFPPEWRTRPHEIRTWSSNTQNINCSNAQTDGRRLHENVFPNARCTPGALPTIGNFFTARFSPTFQYPSRFSSYDVFAIPVSHKPTRRRLTFTRLSSEPGFKFVKSRSVKFLNYPVWRHWPEKRRRLKLESCENPNLRHNRLKFKITVVTNTSLTQQQHQPAEKTLVITLGQRHTSFSVFVNSTSRDNV